jgi:hypothetical protein
MRGVLRAAATAVAASIAVCSPARAAEPPTVLIRVIDYGDTSATVLVEAEHHVARVFGVAGVTVLWREGAQEAAAKTAVQVTVVILSAEMTDEKALKEHLPTGVLGTAAPPPAHRAWIFLRRVEAAAEAQRQSAGMALGHVIVHEVAHMVANVQHSAGGLMAASLQLTDGVQGFSDEEGRQLRAALQRQAGPVILDARERARPFPPPIR